MDTALFLLGLLGLLGGVISLIIKLILKKGMPKKVSGLVILASIVLIVSISSVAGTDYQEKMDTITSQDLQVLAENGEYEKIIKFIDYYEDTQENEKKELVTTAVKIIMNQTSQDEVHALEEYVFNPDTEGSEFIKTTILHNLEESKTKNISVEKVLELFAKSPEKSSIKKSLATYLSVFDEQEINAYYIDKIRQAAEAQELTTVYEIISEYSLLEQADQEKLKELTVQLDSLEGKKEEIQEFNDLIKAKETEIDEIKSQVPSKEVFVLNAYVVQDLRTSYDGLLEILEVKDADTNYYEIAFTEYVPFLGDIPSDQRAILETTVTQFSQQGLFSAYVIEAGEQEVTLAPEQGGFTQTIKVFREIPETAIENIAKLDVLVNERDSYEIQLEERHVNLDYIKNQIQMQINALDGNSEPMATEDVDEAAIEPQTDSVLEYIASSKDQILEFFGDAYVSGDFQGSEFWRYEDHLIAFSFDLETEQVNAIFLGEGAVVGEVTVGMTIEEVISAMGTPQSSGVDEENGEYYISYTIEDNLLVFNAESETAKTSSATLYHK